MKRLFLAGALVAAAALLSPGAASAQTGTARGKVVDEKGQGLEGVQVVMEYQGPMNRKFETKTNKKGEFTQVGMQPGVYRVTPVKEGYVGAFVEIKVTLGDPTYLPADLKMIPKAAAAAAAADKGNDELRAGFEKGNTLMNEGKLDEAEAEFRALLDKNPNVPQLHHNLAVVLSKKKDAAGAEALRSRKGPREPEIDPAGFAILWDLMHRDHMTYQEKSLNRSVLHLLYRAMQCASNLFESEIGIMTPRQFAVLAALDGEEGASQAMLTKRTGIDRSTLSEVVQRILAKGFVVRRRSTTDRRAYTVKLTRQGRQKLTSVRPVVERVDDQILAMIPSRQRDAFVQALSALAEACEKRAREG